VNLGERLKFMRLFKGLSQEEIAGRLGLSVNGYSKIERGDSDVTWSRLKGIAEAMEVQLEQLLGLTENNIFTFIENRNNPKGHSQNHSHVYLTETKCAHELEKYQLLLENKELENKILQERIEKLELINELLKSKIPQ
jgi:transcriptional regulator with XRE-family HTH domain